MKHAIEATLTSCIRNWRMIAVTITFSPPILCTLPSVTPPFRPPYPSSVSIVSAACASARVRIGVGAGRLGHGALLSGVEIGRIVSSQEYIAERLPGSGREERDALISSCPALSDYLSVRRERNSGGASVGRQTGRQTNR